MRGSRAHRIAKRSSARRPLRRGAGQGGWARFARGFALVAMLVQVLFATDHLGATLTAEARQAGWAVPGGSLGLLEVCTGEGIVLMTPEGRVVQQGNAPSHGQGHQCAVCSSASVCHFAAPEGAVLPVLSADLIAAPFASLVAQAIHLPERRSATPIRAPPAAVA